MNENRTQAAGGGEGGKPERAPTQADVARAAGVHRTTVSLALKNHPGLPRATCERIQRIATKLGYAPDPMLSALIARRNRLAPHAFQGTLAWLVNNVPPWDWRPIFHEYYEGAVARAKRYGYGIDVFDLHAPGMTSRRLASIFSSRNIRGILVPPLPQANMELDFPWERFSAVAFGYTLRRPQLHMVGAAQFRGLALAMRKVREKGFRRIGFIYSPEHNERVDHNYLAAYLVEEYMHHGGPLIPPLADMAEFRAWHALHRPEVVVMSSSNRIVDRIRELGLRVPEDIGVVSPFFTSRHETLSGVYENSLRIGETAVDLVVAMIQRGERGVPEAPQRILIDGIWMEGTTLSARPRERA
ncbi:LacI family transcriptional regulator [Opitutaceae bacterium TAV5]|nr:LacI family transcriptional regulator [Opitutaceae bacterium TAV5]